MRFNCTQICEFYLYAKEHIESRGGILITPFFRGILASSYILKIKCHCGHEWSIPLLKIVRRRSWCFGCRKSRDKKKKITGEMKINKDQNKKNEYYVANFRGTSADACIIVACRPAQEYALRICFENKMLLWKFRRDIINNVKALEQRIHKIGGLYPIKEVVVALAIYITLGSKRSITKICAICKTTDTTFRKWRDILKVRSRELLYGK